MLPTPSAYVALSHCVAAKPSVHSKPGEHGTQTPLTGRLPAPHGRHFSEELLASRPWPAAHIEHPG